MNKYSLLMVMFVFLVIVTLIAQDIELASATPDITNLTIDTAQESQSIFNMIGVLFRVLTFQVSGIPTMVNLIVFYPLTIGTMAMIVDVLKDLIPFT